MSATDSQTITSSEQKATQQITSNILTSVSLQQESSSSNQSSCQVGLNMHLELSTKYNAEVKNSLRKCILTRKPDITFDDIAGCDYAKDCIKMSFVVPDQCPNLFEMCNVSPWQSILLYGPPGVGKTMLTQAVC